MSPSFRFWRSGGSQTEGNSMADPIPVTLKATEEFSDWMCLRYGDLDVSRSEFMGSVCALTEEQRAAAERLAGAGALRRTSAAAARMRGRRRGRKSACACSPGSVSRMTRLPGTARDGCPDAGTGKGKCPGGDVPGRREKNKLHACKVSS